MRRMGQRVRYVGVLDVKSLSRMRTLDLRKAALHSPIQFGRLRTLRVGWQDIALR